MEIQRSIWMVRALLTLQLRMILRNSHSMKERALMIREKRCLKIRFARIPRKSAGPILQGIK